jgi:aspartyl/asparaginyl beta-hydroxylase (cupin superfamily)
MSKVERIEAEIAKLSPVEIQQVSRWLQEFLGEQWDQQIASDAQAGRLDFLFDEAAAERKASALRPWPADEK